MGTAVQISAFVSRDTRDLLDRLVASTGQKKAHVVEVALRHHLLALQQIPAEYVIPPVLVVDRESGEKVLRRLRRPGKPAAALRKLMRGNGD
ncbi:MAG: hypothetical protein HYY18_11010 [Planctomycetes bacterium]|nr:hypothetical protein [Planctomycetota bacterium]